MGGWERALEVTSRRSCDVEVRFFVATFRDLWNWMLCMYFMIVFSLAIVIETGTFVVHMSSFEINEVETR